MKQEQIQKSKIESIVEDVLKFLKIRWWAVVIIIGVAGFFMSGFKMKGCGVEIEKQEIKIPQKNDIK